MTKIRPINTTADGLAFAIKASYFRNTGPANLTNGGGHFPSTGVIEISEDHPDWKNLEVGQ